MAKKKVIKKSKRTFKKYPCRLCKDKVKDLDYKEVDLLKKFISDRGKILPTRLSGNCTKHQRMVANRVKRARLAGLLPFVKEKEGSSRHHRRR